MRSCMRGLFIRVGGRGWGGSASLSGHLLLTWEVVFDTSKIGLLSV